MTEDPAATLKKSFCGDSFSTPVGVKIKQAVMHENRLDRTQLYAEICSTIRETKNGPSHAIEAFQTLLQTDLVNEQVMMQTLNLLEYCVQKCDFSFLKLVSEVKFTKKLVQLISSQGGLTCVVQDRVVGLIHVWAEEFHNDLDLHGFVDVYTEMKCRGIEFPEVAANKETDARALQQECGKKIKNDLSVLYSVKICTYRK